MDFYLSIPPRKQRDPTETGVTAAEYYKNLTWVCGYDRQFCPEGHFLASRGSASDPMDRFVYPIHKHMFGSFSCILWVPALK